MTETAAAQGQEAGEQLVTMAHDIRNHVRP